MTELSQKSDAAFEHNLTRACVFLIGALISTRVPVTLFCILMGLGYIFNGAACKIWPEYMCGPSIEERQ